MIAFDFIKLVVVVDLVVGLVVVLVSSFVVDFLVVLLVEMFVEVFKFDKNFFKLTFKFDVFAFSGVVIVNSVVVSTVVKSKLFPRIDLGVGLT